MDPINFFMSPEHLEPKCKSCNCKIDFGVTTEWDEKSQGHKCKNCGVLVD